MCGFTGFVGFKNTYPEKSTRLNLLNDMAAPISRRGPDDQTLYDDGTLSFAFRRLSIVDLQSGQQPIWNETGNIFVAVNGEIYNHRELHSSLKGKHEFRTNSDSEIILHLYEEMGPKCLDLLIGMFAAVIWDKTKKELFLARDRMGIKPLYYAQVKEGLIFGSELKSLLAFPLCPREVDWSPILLSTSKGNLDGTRVSTGVKGVEFLPGGSYATLREGEVLSESKYWSIENYFAKPGDPKNSTSFYVDRYAELIEDSVNKRLMSDVPVGSFLSGGLDSALVTAIAAKKNKDLHCFHALEQTTFLCGDSTAARKLTTELGIPFHSVLFDMDKLLDKLNFSLKDFEYFIWLMDSPRFDMEIFLKHELHRFAKTKVPSLKVMLLGQGSDEFAGGYSNTNGLVEGWDAYIESGLKRDAQWAFFERDKVPENTRESISVNRYLNSNTAEENYQEMVRGRVKLLQAFNLWHEDRTSSSQGVESRVPFLDHRLVEFLVSIPGSLHRDLFWDKKIVRLAAERWISKDLAHRPKIGFYTTRDQTSIWNIQRQIVNRIFPKFKEKYLNAANSLFSTSALDNMFDSSQIDGSKSWIYIERIINYMSFACFSEMCQTQRKGCYNNLKPPSPLVQVDAGEAEKLWKLEDWDIKRSSWETPPKRWNILDCPMLADGANVIYNLPDSLTISQLGRNEVVIELSPETEWVFSLFRVLAAKNYVPLSCKQIARKLKLPLSELMGTIRVLSKMKVLFAYKNKDVRKKKAA